LLCTSSSSIKYILKIKIKKILYNNYIKNLTNCFTYRYHQYVVSLFAVALFRSYNHFEYLIVLILSNYDKIHIINYFPFFELILNILTNSLPLTKLFYVFSSILLFQNKMKYINYNYL
jgi:hypothetical protein